MRSSTLRGMDAPVGLLGLLWVISYGKKQGITTDLMMIILVFLLTSEPSSAASGIQPFSARQRHKETSAPARRGTS